MRRRFSLSIGDHLKTPGGKRHSNEKVFGEIAARYDLITRILSFGADRRWKRDLVAALASVQAQQRAELACVDLACGTGDISLLVAQQFPKARVVGLDICPEMLEVARTRASGDQLRFVQQDMTCLQFELDSIDLVTGGYALRNAPELSTTLGEIHRILKPGGVAAFLDFSKPRAS